VVLPDMVWIHASGQRFLPAASAVKS